MLRVTEGKDQDLKQALNTVAHAEETEDEKKTRKDSEEKAEAIKGELKRNFQDKSEADDVVFNVTDFAEHPSGWTGIKMP